MSEIQILSATHGIAPRSDELLRIGGDVERGRLERSVFEDKLEQETNEWLELQREVGIDIQENGKLRWQDHLRPIVKATRGFAPDIDNAPVTRWLGTNTFYRKPTIIDQLTLDESALKQEIGEVGTHLSILSPGSFEQHCDNQYNELPADLNILGLYSSVIKFCINKQMERITFVSTTNQLDLEDIFVARKWGQVIATLADCSPTIQFSYIKDDQTLQPGYQSSLPIGSNCPSNLALEVSENTLKGLGESLPAANKGTERLQCWRKVIDAATTAKDEITPSQAWLSGLYSTQPASVVLTHTTDLQYLPLPYAQEKIKSLGEAKEQLKQAIGE